MASYNVAATPKSKYRVMNFNGGLNLVDSDMNLQDNEATDLLNVTFTERGAFRKRPGVALPPSFPHKEDCEISTIYRSYHRDGTSEFIAFFMDGTVKASREEGEPYDIGMKDKDGLDYGVLSGKPVSCFSYNNKTYFTNDSDGLFVIEPDHLTEAKQIIIGGTTPFKPNYAIVHHNRVFYTGNPDAKDRVYFSQLNDPTTVEMTINDVVHGGSTTTGGGGIIDLQSNEVEITGLAVFLDALVIFKSDSVFSLTGYTPDTDFKVSRINVASGCIAPRSIVSANNGVYFLGKDGVYVLTTPFEGYIATRAVSEKITPIFRSIVTEAQKIHAVYKDKCYFLFHSEGTLMFDEVLTSWTKFDTKMNCSLSDTKRNVVFMGGENGFVYCFDSLQLHDEYKPGVITGIDAFYSSAYYSLGEPEVTKKFKGVKIFYKPDPESNVYIAVKTEVDYKDKTRLFLSSYLSLIWGETPWGYQDDPENYTWWGGIRDQLARMIRFTGGGLNIRLTFSNSGVNEQLGIDGFVFVYKRKSKVR